MLIQAHQISRLSPKAKLKGKLLYYSLILQSINFLFLGLATNPKSKLSVFYILIASIGLISYYKFRPDNIQHIINKWLGKSQFPIRRNSVKILRFSMTLSILMGSVQIFFHQRPIETHSALMIFLSVPALIFIYDKELTNFIWDSQSIDTKNKFPIFRLFLISLLALIVLAFGFKAYKILVATYNSYRINKCIESGGCIDPGTLICGPYVKDPTKACGLPKPGP